MGARRAGISEPMRLSRALRRLDHETYLRVARTQFPQPADRLLRDLTDVASHSVLWLGLAGLMGASGRISLRRAGLRGLLAIGIASPLVNVGIKGLAGRRRPLNDLVPIGRRAVMPTSSSFPSGHSASAAAFATAVAMEAPAPVTVSAAVLAGLVGFSRVYVGVHYPADVLAGAAIGVGAGLATHLLWPSPPWSVSVGQTLPVASDPRGRGLVVVVNPGAGKGAPRPVVPAADLIRRSLPEAEIVELCAGTDFGQTLHEAAARATVLAVAGGDGTVSAGAVAALRYGKPLLVIPGGTLNHFARTIGLETPAGALRAYTSGSRANVDVGLIAGKPFLNTASFGVYTDLVAERDRLSVRLGKWPAFAVAAMRVLRTAEPVEVTIDGRRRKVWLAFFGNCAFRSHGSAPTAWRTSLDDGQLDIRLVLAPRKFARSRGFAGVLTGTGSRAPAFRRSRQPAVKVQHGPEPFEIAHDGERAEASRDFTVSKLPQALQVFVPIRPTSRHRQ